MAKDNAVFASSLRKTYDINGLLVEALKGVDLQVAEGEFVTVYGPSGAGKTTLLNLIGGLDKPSSGELSVFGHDLARHDEDFLATFRCSFVGYVFQSYNLISTLTALENIAFPIHMAGWTDAKVKERSETLLELVGLADRADHFPSQLSGGEQQRAAFARALANDPPLVLADEPTGNLDMDTGMKIIEVLRGLKGGKTVIVATHDRRILALADRRLTLSDGRVVSHE